MRRSTSLVIAIACGLAACGSKPPKDDAPTLKTLAKRSVSVEPDRGIAGNEEQAIAAYRKFLEVAPAAPQRAEAMRRLGDLEMDSADNKSANDGDAPDYRAAIKRYEEFLRTYPKDPGNDRVLYQLARAQEQGGELETSLKTLDRLVVGYPNTAYRDEAQFRRGELLFTMRNYSGAEKAYTTVLASDGNPYRERALYMQGWSIFKQGRLEDALHSFFGVLDLKLAPETPSASPPQGSALASGRPSGEPVAGRDGDGLDLQGLSRADRELVEDTFRVTSLSLANLNGADSIKAYIDSDARRSYEFRVFQQLGELYGKQERYKDAADALGLFARTNPLHAQAPQLQARVIGIYQQAGFAGLALDAKKEYVARYGRDSEFRRANAAGWERAQPLVKSHLGELAQHYHASAQKSKAAADYQEAVRWYREWLVSFPTDPQAAHNNFLLAELLFETSRHAEAAVEYEKTAYGYPRHAKSADAGYAAVLAHAEQVKRAGANALPALQRAGVDSELRFANTFIDDPRAAPVLTHAAETLYALQDGERATTVAKQLLALKPPAGPGERRVAWTVVAHTAFERSAFPEAERAYGEVLALTPESDKARPELVERLAASVYKQGEQARTAGNTRKAVAHFERVAAVAPQSAVRANAQYDAAAALIELKDWAAAAKALEDFRQRFANHALKDDVSAKLAVAYTEQGQWSNAAGEFERIAAVNKDVQVARSAQWQAAELYEKAGSRSLAAKAYERFLQRHPDPLEQAIEARWRLAQMAKQDGQAARELALMKDIFQADQRGGSARTDRTRTLGAAAALALAEPTVAAYKQVALVEPLARQLKLKKTRMEEALKAYSVAAGYGVAEFTTAATFHIAALYQDFGKSLMTSQRPKKLSKLELEQYNVLLEEQAFPFEEKAIGLHEGNAMRASQGVYDDWVKRSFTALRDLRPVRWGKTERTEGDTPAARLNKEAIALRQQGQFAKAREAYEKAMETEPAYTATLLNLGILHDLYLGDAKRALELYDRYLALSPGGDAQVTKWVADLKNRKQHVATGQEKP